MSDTAILGVGSDKDEELAELVRRDMRVAFLAVHSRSVFGLYLPELYTGIEEEGRSASSVVRDLGESRLNVSLSSFWAFRRRCQEWKVWVSLREFEAAFSVFSSEELRSKGNVWVGLKELFGEGRLPDFRDEGFSFVLLGRRLQDATGSNGKQAQGRKSPGRVLSCRSGNRKQINQLRLEAWIWACLGPSALLRFLSPLFPESRPLTWCQVSEQLRKVRKAGEKFQRKCSVTPAAMVPSIVQPDDSLGTGQVTKVAGLSRRPKGGGGSERVERIGEVLVFPASACVPAAVNGVELVEVEKNGLLELFGDLPNGGRLDEFLFSAGGVKLRSGDFWRKVAEEAGADFRGNIEFGGLNMGVGPGGLGNLLAWCEGFSLALTSALGFKNRPYAGAMCHHPKYRSFHPWFSVLGHLMSTVWGIDPFGRREELYSYFAQSRLRIEFPNGGGEAELGSMEETLCLYLVHSSLGNAVAEFLVVSLAVEWKNAASRIYLGEGPNSPWRTSNYNVLFGDYSKAVFSSAPDNLENEVKRQLFKSGVFE
jgi:hypothetical protein